MSTTARPSRVKRALRLLREALPWNRKHRPARAARIDSAREALQPPPKPFPCIERARAQSLHGPAFQVNMCLQETREAYLIPAREPDAASAWRTAKDRHTNRHPERGFPVFWTGGSAGHGHVAISAGNGWIWSVDIKRRGFWDLVRLEAVETRWGLTYAGWAKDLNGVTIKHGEAVKS